MAKQGRMVLSGFSGRIGSVIGYRRGGRWCLRSMPQQVHNPRTEAQQRHRSLFRAEVQLAARMRWPVTMCLTQLARERHMTAQNLFVRMNHPLWDEGALTVDYGCLQLSTGTLAPVAVTGVELCPPQSLRTAPLDKWSNGQEPVAAAALPLDKGKCPEGGWGAILTVSFEPNPTRSHRAGRYDEVFLYAYSPSAGAGYLFNSVYRYTKHISVVLPQWLQTDDTHLYIMCRSNRDEWSATTHAVCATQAAVPDTDDTINSSPNRYTNNNIHDDAHIAHNTAADAAEHPLPCHRLNEGAAGVRRARGAPA